jgi:hypothetical protein
MGLDAVPALLAVGQATAGNAAASGEASAQNAWHNQSA